MNYLLYKNGENAEELKTLYMVIPGAAPDSFGKKLTMESVYTLVYPESKFEKGKLQKLMVELNELLRTFLSYKPYISKKMKLSYIGHGVGKKGEAYWKRKIGGDKTCFFIASIFFIAFLRKGI